MNSRLFWGGGGVVHVRFHQKVAKINLKNKIAYIHFANKIAIRTVINCTYGTYCAPCAHLLYAYHQFDTLRARI